MKVVSTQEAGFVPITVALSIETKAELEALYQLGNHATLVSEQVGVRNTLNEDVKPTLQQFLDGLYEALSAYHTRYC